MRRTTKYTSITSFHKPTSTSRLHKKKSALKKKRRPKPPDHPRRPLSAYNIFFQEQRSLIIGAPAVAAITSEDAPDTFNPNGDARTSFERKKRAHRRTHGKISFSDLAKRIGQMWNSLDANDRRRYEIGAGEYSF